MAPTSKKGGLLSGSGKITKSTPSSKKTYSTKADSSFPKSSSKLTPSASSYAKIIPPSSSSYAKPKSSASFGVIWIPTKRHNKQKKDTIYESYRDDYKTKKYPHNYFMKETLVSSDTSTMPKAGDMVTTPEREGIEPSTYNGDDSKDMSHDSENSPKKYKADEVVVKIDSNQEDKMDGVYAKTQEKRRREQFEEEGTDASGCDKTVIDCLYYTMQCCECAIS